MEIDWEREGNVSKSPKQVRELINIKKKIKKIEKIMIDREKEKRE